YCCPIPSLKLEEWPSTAAANMATFIADTRQVLTDTVRSLEATTASASEDYAMLQRATIADELIEANVYINLGFPSPINPPSDTAPTAAPINTVETISDLYGDPYSV